MSTRTTNPPDLSEDRDPTTDHPPSSIPPDTPKMDLSLAQVVGGSLAAATAAALGSRLGVVGTITGAAVVSVIASIAGALYTTSLRRTRYRMARALGTMGGGRARPPLPRPHLQKVAVGAAAVFALAAGGVTGAELLTGTSLNGRSGSTTVSTSLQGDAGSTQPSRMLAPTAPSSTVASSSSPSAGASASPTASPTTSVSPTPSPVVPTPSPADALTPSATPSGSPATPSSEPSAQASPSGDPSVQDTSVPVTP